MRSSMYVFLDVSIVLIVLFMLQKYKWSTLDPLRQIVHKLFFYLLFIGHCINDISREFNDSTTIL